MTPMAITRKVKQSLNPMLSTEQKKYGTLEVIKLRKSSLWMASPEKKEYGYIIPLGIRLSHMVL